MNPKLQNFIRAVDTFDGVCGQVPFGAWDNDSPCEGWTARDIVGHQCSVLDALAAFARTGRWHRPHATEPPEDPQARWSQTRAEVVTALSQPGVLEREDKYWFGEMDMATFISYVQWDPLTHAWDVGKATGVAVNLPPELCRISYDLIGARADMFRETGRIGPPVEVPEDASIVDRYLGLVGRRP